MSRSAARPTTNLSAYDLYLRALSTFYPITKERVFAALGLLEQAIAIDPNYGPALSWAAICHMRLVNDGWTEAPETNRGRATDFARQALQMAQNDPGTLANAAEALAYFGEDIGAMIGLVDRALALNPSFARGWYRSGVLRVWAGQPDLAIEHIETSLRLSPRERMGQPLTVMGIAYFLKRRFDEAALKLLLSIQNHPGFPNSYRTLAACYAHMGRLDEARAIVARLRTITPQVVPSDLPWRNPEHRELFLSGLRLAAGEEHEPDPPSCRDPGRGQAMRAADLLERMRANPQADWTIADIERLCRACGLTITPPSRGSHCKVRDPKGGTVLTIPARRPVKAVYIRALVALADRLREGKDG